MAPAINEEMFPDTQYGARTNNWYWASHQAAGNSSAAWAINFDDGFTGFNAGTGDAWNAFQQDVAFADQRDQQQPQVLVPGPAPALVQRE